MGQDEGADCQKNIHALSAVHDSFDCKLSGVHISKQHLYLAASPDGVVSCKCCGKGVLELKCPFSARENTIMQYAMADDSSITLPDGGTLHLKRDHSHYYQVQAQMLVCGVTYCDYVVWTEREAFIERIPIDSKFCENLLQTSNSFFRCVLLPELQFKYFSNKVTDNGQKNCWCEGTKKGKTITCSNTLCARKLFHLRCVGLRSKPRGQWLCKDCE